MFVCENSEVCVSTIACTIPEIANSGWSPRLKVRTSMCVCVSVCVCVHVCMCACVYVCACVCVSVYLPENEDLVPTTYIQIVDAPPNVDVRGLGR